MATPEQISHSQQVHKSLRDVVDDDPEFLIRRFQGKDDPLGDDNNFEEAILILGTASSVVSSISAHESGYTSGEYKKTAGYYDSILSLTEKKRYFILGFMAAKAIEESLELQEHFSLDVSDPSNIPDIENLSSPAD
jgi:hypothetical protein